MQRKIISFSIDFCNYIIIKLNALQKWNGDITLILLFFEQKFSSSYYLQMAILSRICVSKPMSKHVFIMWKKMCAAHRIASVYKCVESEQSCW